MKRQAVLDTDNCSENNDRMDIVQTARESATCRRRCKQNRNKANKDRNAAEIKRGFEAAAGGGGCEGKRNKRTTTLLEIPLFRLVRLWWGWDWTA
jgi:hypothetical protein